MATAIASPTLLTLEEYLHTSYRPDRHFVDGYLEERNLGTRLHGRMQMLAGTWFFNHEKNVDTYTVYGQRIQVSPTRVRVIDICVTSRKAPIEQVVLTPPLLCVEILSPEDRLPRAAKVMEDYAKMGVPNLWLLDPVDRIAYIYTGDGHFQLTAGPLAIASTPIHLDLAALFESLDD